MYYLWCFFSILKYDNIQYFDTIDPNIFAFKLERTAYLEQKSYLSTRKSG